MPDITRKLFRPQPVGPAALYQTYQLLRPARTHFRKATCAEVECPNRERGWKTIIDLSTKLGQQQANYIRLHSGRHFSSYKKDGDLIVFEFPAGQNCFTSHRIDLEREPIFRKKGGDFRGNPLGLPTQTLRPRDWLDDFGEHQEKLAAEQQKG